MMRCLWSVGRSFLFMLEPERAHELAISVLKNGFLGAGQIEHDCLRTRVAGIDFPNPLGLAAGFDKNAEITEAILRLGFGFGEIGTLTPLPQAGNVRPRLFRLEEEAAIINRMGFNNDGHEAAYQRLKRSKKSGIIGVNIGANKDSSDRIADYKLGVHRFYDVADYFTINVSSPNTPGLRDLQLRDALADLLRVVCDAREKEQARVLRFVPIFLKIAPDMTEKTLDDVAEILSLSDIDGLIVSNTTLSRACLANHDKKQAGGLSGKPLFDPSTIVLAKMRQRVGAAMPIIGVGGVCDAQSALEKIRAGADLVQLYSGMVFGGPYIAAQILVGLIDICRKDGVSTIAHYRDQSLTSWAQQPLIGSE